MSSSHLFFGLPIVLLVLYLELSSGFHSAAFFLTIFHSVMSQFSMLISISFFCVFCSSIESLHIPSCQLRQLCFFLCSQSNPLLRSQPCQYLYQSLHQMSLRFCALTITAFIISATIFCLVIISFLNFMFNNLLFNVFVFSFRLYDEA